MPPDTALPPAEPGLIGFFLALLSCPLYLLGFAFWVWMLVDCILREPDRLIWMFVIFFLSVPGALIYFVIRWLPRRRVRAPRFMGRWLRRREVERAEADARNIGNAHQFVLLGDVLRETGQLARAAEAYHEAVTREPETPQALWGAGTVARRMGRHEEAREYLAALMAIDRDYKFGDASLAYGHTLFDLGDVEAARAHILEHLDRRDDPEARILLARIHAAQGRADDARVLLEQLIVQLRPARDARNRRARSDASRLLRKLPRP